MYFILIYCVPRETFVKVVKKGETKTSHKLMFCFAYYRPRVVLNMQNAGFSAHFSNC